MNTIIEDNVIIILYSFIPLYCHSNLKNILTKVLLEIHVHRTLVRRMEILCSLFYQFLKANLLMIGPHASKLALIFCNDHTRVHKTRIKFHYLKVSRVRYQNFFLIKCCIQDSNKLTLTSHIPSCRSGTNLKSK